MKKICTLIGLAIAFHINAQNWSIVMPNDTLVYEKQDNHQFFTVWVDSMQVNGTDTTYFMNQISPGEVLGPASHSDVCIEDHYYFYFFTTLFREKTKPQFCGSSVTISGSSTTVKFPQGEFIIYADGPVGSKWVCDSVALDTMEIISSSNAYLDLFQVQDSIKIFKFREGTFTLSKNHGIISNFDLRTTNGAEFSLVGIQNLGLGDVIPMYDDFTNFNVGDVFVRYAEMGDSEYISKSVFKHKIISKSLINDTLLYQYLDVKYNMTGSIKFWKQKNPILDAYPNTIAPGSPIFIPLLNDTSTLMNVLVSRNDAGDIQKRTYPIDGALVRGYCDNADFWVEYFAYSYYLIYQKGLEPLWEEYRVESGFDRSVLIGYIVNGVPHGDTTSVSEIDYSQFIHIYPNPAKNQLIIATEKLNGKIRFEMMDLQGRIVNTGDFERQITTDVSGFSNGIYFVILKNQEGAILYREKVIVQ